MLRLNVVALASAALLAGCAATPARSPASKTIVIPAGWDAAYDKYHYAPAVRVGDTVYVSGIPAGRGATYEEKIKNLFERLKQVLEASGASLADVVEIQSFHADVHDSAAFQAEFARFLTLHQVYFPDGYPAWTAVGTTALLSEGAPVEMRAVAVIGAGRQVRVERAASGKP
jgi:enamine deaminase RidA (YjgF/YER057c/UK114 family)